MRVIKVYKNGIIKLPYSSVKKLNLKQGSFLVIEERSYGFVLSKLEVYNTFLGQFEQDMKTFDAEIKEISNKLKEVLRNMLNKKSEIDVPDKSEKGII